MSYLMTYLDNSALLAHTGRILGVNHLNPFGDGSDVSSPLNSLLKLQLYAIANSNLINLGSLVTESFLVSEGGRRCFPYKFYRSAAYGSAGSEREKSFLGSISSNLHFRAGRRDYFLFLSYAYFPSGGDANNATRSLHAANISCFFPLKLQSGSLYGLYYSGVYHNIATRSLGNIENVLRNSFISSSRRSLLRPNNVAELRFLGTHYANILRYLLDAQFFMRKINQLMQSFNLSGSPDADFKNLFVLNVDGYDYNSIYLFVPRDRLPHAANIGKWCNDYGIVAAQNVFSMDTIFLFTYSDSVSSYFRNDGMDYIFSCFV